jgi:radical SAM protein with 4Fe4S-binding SPASM domain
VCPTGINKLNIKPVFMSFNIFKAIIKKIPTLRKVGFFNWGEPFLNPDIFKMIHYAHERGIHSYIHTNLSFKKDEDFFARIIRSGADELVVSLDGGSQRTYSRYRVGGNFNLVLANMKNIVKLKKEFKSTKPKVTWKFIINKFNEHEIAKAYFMAKRIKVHFKIDFMGLSDDLPDVQLEDNIEERKKYWLPKNEQFVRKCYIGKYRYPLFDGICTQLFTMCVVNSDGAIFPCCWITDERNAFGNLLKDSMSHIWNNKKYVYSRSLFTKGKKIRLKHRTICAKCNNFLKIAADV